MIKAKTTFQLLVFSICLALIITYSPMLLFSRFVMQAQFVLACLMIFGLLSFYAYTQANISNTLHTLSKEKDARLLPKYPNLSRNISLKELFTFSHNLISFIRIQILSQEKLIDDYTKTTEDLKSHIMINQKFLKFAQLSMVAEASENIHNLIQQEILSILDSFDASSFYLTDNCYDYLRLDSSYGFSNDDFLLRSVPSADFSIPIVKEKATIRLFEKIPYSHVNHFMSNIESSETLLDYLEMPIYIDEHLYGIFFFYNTHPDKVLSNKVRLLLNDYTPQALSAVTNKILVKKTFFLSKYDSLTGLYNRSYFEQYFEDFNKHALRYKEHYSIILIDLNRLKVINDKFGHVAGDRALQEFASIFKSKIRETDILARFGGDEFICIFHNSTLEETRKRLKLIHEEFSHHHIRYGGFNIPIRFSYGVATSPDESMILNVLVKIADDRMYSLKDQLHEQEKDVFDF